MKVKNLIITVVLALTPSISTADKTTSAVEELCKESESLAGSIMKGRQAGVPMRKMTKLVGDVSDNNASIIAAAMVSDAYAVPQAQKKGTQQQIVEKFKNMVYESCRENLMGK